MQRFGCQQNNAVQIDVTKLITDYNSGMYISEIDLGLLNRDLEVLRGTPDKADSHMSKEQALEDMTAIIQRLIEKSRYAPKRGLEGDV